MESMPGVESHEYIKSSFVNHAAEFVRSLTDVRRMKNGWPPQYLLLCSSIGGALSPFVWRMYRSVRGYPVVPTEMDGSEPPQ